MNKPTATVMKKPQQVIDELRAKEAAKANQGASNTSTEAPKAATGTDATATPKKSSRKRLTKKDWIGILEYKDKNDLTAADIAEEYSVSENNVYQWSSKLKKESQEDASITGDKDLVGNAKKMLSGVDGELKAFDKKIEEAKAMVANADKDRKAIEGKKEKYQKVIDMFSDKK